MRALITAGGTSEAIDPVRSITNHSTGRLGAAIAEAFIRAGWEVTYICGESATEPSRAEVARVGGVNSLIEMLDNRLRNFRFDCVIHAMAVSDYTPRGVLDLNEAALNLANALTGKAASPDIIREKILGSVKPVGGMKISSDIPDMAVLLTQTPKVIERFKELQPDTVLVGFKLLSGVPEAELLQAARRLMERNNCDYVVANDLADIRGGVHKAVMIDKNGVTGRASAKNEIAELVLRRVSERCGK